MRRIAELLTVLAGHYRACASTTIELTTITALVAARVERQVVQGGEAQRQGIVFISVVIDACLKRTCVRDVPITRPL